MSQPPARSARIVSLDQFRGYTVAGMILVNYLGSFALTPQVLRHHNTYFSYADTIMPAFHFAVGFALRLTLLKRLETLGPRRAYFRAVRRSLGLILLSTVLEYAASGHRPPSWAVLRQAGLWATLAGPLKCQFWETLAILGVTALWVLPVIAARARVRIAFLVACAGLHGVLAQLFYFHFLYARPNWLDPLWGATNVKGLDGGPLGFLAWSVPQLLGSLAYDAVAARGWRAFPRLLGGAAILMAAGYGLSCLAMSYPPTQPPATAEGEIQVAASPVLPPRAHGRPPQFLLAEPPFRQPPAEEQRQLNYWLMDKRVVTLPFNLFASGFALAVYAFLVVLGDGAGWQVGLFRTFGQNALAAYILHEMVASAVTAFAPADSPPGWVGLTFVLYAGITYLFVRHLENNGIYLRL